MSCAISQRRSSSSPRDRAVSRSSVSTTTHGSSASSASAPARRSASTGPGTSPRSQCSTVRFRSGRSSSERAANQRDPRPRDHFHDPDRVRATEPGRAPRARAPRRSTRGGAILPPEHRLRRAGDRRPGRVRRRARAAPRPCWSRASRASSGPISTRCSFVGASPRRSAGDRSISATATHSSRPSVSSRSRVRRSRRGSADSSSMCAAKPAGSSSASASPPTGRLRSRWEPDGRPARSPRRAPLHTFPALGVVDVVESALSFGRALVRAILRRDRSQANNLRLSAFRRSLRETGDALREACQKDVKVNPTPEPYRAFAIARAASRTGDGDAAIPAGTKLRYSSRWRALVPGIDLRATFLCGDRLLVGAAAETFCLNRATGEIIWRVGDYRGRSHVGRDARWAGAHSTPPLASVLRVHDFGNGEVTLHERGSRSQSGGPASGAVVHVQGLPRLLIVTEGDRHLVAIDLTSGEPRWRHAWGGTTARKPGAGATHGVPRMKRRGREAPPRVTSGDSALHRPRRPHGRRRLAHPGSPSLSRPPDSRPRRTLRACGGLELGGTGPRGRSVLGARALVEDTPPASKRRRRPLHRRRLGPLGRGGRLPRRSRPRRAPPRRARPRERKNIALGEWPRGSRQSGTAWLAVDDLLHRQHADGRGRRDRRGQRRASVSPSPRPCARARRPPPARPRPSLGRPLRPSYRRPRASPEADGALIRTIAPCDAIPDLLALSDQAGANASTSPKRAATSSLSEPVPASPSCGDSPSPVPVPVPPPPRRRSRLKPAPPNRTYLASSPTATCKVFATGAEACDLCPSRDARSSDLHRLRENVPGNRDELHTDQCAVRLAPHAAPRRKWGFRHRVAVRRMLARPQEEDAGRRIGLYRVVVSPKDWGGTHPAPEGGETRGRRNGPPFEPSARAPLEQTTGLRIATRGGTPKTKLICRSLD